MAIAISSQQARQHTHLETYAGRILKLLKEPTVTDVCVNADGRMWVHRAGNGFTCEGEFPSAQAQLLLSGIATVREVRFDHDHPILQTIFPPTGDRIEGLLWPVVTDPIFAIRTRQKQTYRLQDYADSEVLTAKGDPRNRQRHRDDFLEQIDGADHITVLRAACLYRRNIVVAGPPGSGKTTFSNAILAEIAEATPNDRVVMIEDTPELQCSLPNHVQLLETANVSQAKLLAATLRLIPHRIVVGEVREPEPARNLLTAWNSGGSGGLATIHADSALGGLRKLETLVGGHRAEVREQIGEAVGLVVFIDRCDVIRASRKVREVVVVKGFNPDTQDYAHEYV